MDKKEIEIPFGASDSELMEATYFIPQGYHAVIEGNKVIVKKGEQPISNDLEEAAIEALRTEYEKGRADTIQELQDALVNHQGHTSNDYKKGDVNFISDKEYLDRAIDFIVDREEENDYICEKLHEIPEEFKICSEDCQNLDHWCVLRFLMHYTLKKL